MPTACCVVDCRSGYKQTKNEREQQQDFCEEKKPISTSVHRFPITNKMMYDKWKKALSFMDFSHLKHFSKAGVCQLHFKETDYYPSDMNNKRQPRKRRILKQDAIPSIFTSKTIPNYMKQKPIEPRQSKLATPTARQDRDRDETVVPVIGRALFRGFGRNVVEKANSQVHANVGKKKKAMDNGEELTRSRAAYKKQKLSSVK